MNDVIYLGSEAPQRTKINSDGYIAPVSKKSHAADPIVDRNMIAEISEYFVANGKYRSNLLFLLGCNCGLRCGEILGLNWGQLIDADGNVKDTILFIEEKNSKKDKITGELIKGRIHSREVTVNNVVKEAIELFIDHCETISLSDYVFKSESKSAKFYSQRRAEGKGAKHDHLTRQAVDKILKQTIKEALGYLDMNVSTHTMRKTFARQVWDNAPESQKHNVARFLQKMLGHADPASTLHYIGVTNEEMHDTFMSLELGRRIEDASNSKVIILNQMSERKNENGSLCR